SAVTRIYSQNNANHEERRQDVDIGLPLHLALLAAPPGALIARARRVHAGRRGDRSCHRCATSTSGTRRSPSAAALRTAAASALSPSTAGPPPTTCHRRSVWRSPDR